MKLGCLLGERLWSLNEALKRRPGRIGEKRASRIAYGEIERPTQGVNSNFSRREEPNESFCGSNAAGADKTKMAKGNHAHSSRGSDCMDEGGRRTELVRKNGGNWRFPCSW